MRKEVILVPNTKDERIVLTAVISHYLESHKRLVVPQLGTFIVKEPGVSVVFSEMLRRDDGVLRELLKVEGRSELEAAGEIDRFVFEVHHAVQNGENYSIPSFGVFGAGANNTVLFTYTSCAEPTESRPTEAHSAAESPLAAPDADLDMPHVSPSVKMNPDPSLRGLRYGRPHKNTDAYSFVDRVPRRRVDRFVWFALIAVVIALAAIAFGYFNGSDREEPTVELAAPADAPVSEAAADQSDQPEPNK